MGSFNVEFLNSELEFCSDLSENLYYDSTKKEIKEWLNSIILEVDRYFKQDKDNYVNICSLDIWGNKKDGYDFNNIYSKEKINTINEFIDYWNNETFNLIYKRTLKAVGYKEVN